jgi:heterodisulfide reductase subunit A
MSAAAHHDQVETLTYTDVESIVAARDGFDATLVRRPRYVDEAACIGCRLCEYACPVDVPHEFDGGLGARRAIYVPFGTAIPQKAVVDLPNCILCGKCEKACPTDAIDFLQDETDRGPSGRGARDGIPADVHRCKPEYGSGALSNVHHRSDMERCPPIAVRTRPAIPDGKSRSASPTSVRGSGG